MTDRDPFSALLSDLARDTRRDVEEAARRLMLRVDDVVAHASGLAAQRVDEAGETLSATVHRSVGRWAHQVGDRIVRLGELVGERL